MVVEIIISFFIVLSGIFGLVGSFGLIKLDDTMQRLHAPTKATTLGVGGALIASMLYFLLVKGSFSFHELLITLFLFLTAPITANFIAKAYLAHNATRNDLPETGRDYGWALYDDPPLLNETTDPRGE
ncbi:Na+/H+ antiporter subunit G [Ponticoccus sp. SC2-23]|uniref:Na+/H+ antiporter subunit G n=1 Tax=Alexandriicola marinus TaxID=2081710 RepID=UPI000FD8E14E|nr:Na+/H+ antiporter subunit G [Alexandriicola marinus]MBM1218964.1 Na+/H+ antiporter subunit G [Ponticoccus sp. SC6-9]MBM1223964.1 Na+/H+ antiporter subunit G [Ponticoccus sp. SC6-15]MBM1230257.1 Na+/H+ antiporter subunit G [Ponticoccus sp. SC6-38]MBM1232930.1 Na+/H+ antiporter subunit G [Ponticoccus sp. SC6-45]MBM1237120.1 Na+/H+ antiporter subunit G [Ponticoccus sp. SC6-49]MBM1241941.1 Na+/H+ antiporter subunit G [Ponticoccus sp. SC2-64]MBM1246454.1 Na+/H+ antiporter subunit G [Ponticoccu